MTASKRKLSAPERQEIERRDRLQRRCAADPKFRALELEMCRRDVVHWINNWCWTYDPRRTAYLPFVLFPRQVELVRWIEARCTQTETGVLEKSRDVGASWVCCMFALHRWLFVPGWKTGFGANKADQVDLRGEPDSLFEKMRIALGFMPRWMRPEGFSLDRHCPQMRIINPVNGNVVAGYIGVNMGRGGRSSIFFVDEAAHVEQAQRVDAALSANSDTLIWLSSALDNTLFQRKAQSGRYDVFRFHYSQDPRKTPEWVEAKKADTDPLVWAQEYEIDYEGSVENRLIAKAWVQASFELRRRLAAECAAYLAGPGQAGMDVGAGKAESVLARRYGPVVPAVLVRRDPDTIDLAAWALDQCAAHHCRTLNYDSVGVGHGLVSAFKRAQSVDLKVYPVNTGAPATQAKWPDGIRAVDRFANLRAELWWRVREALLRTYKHLRYLDGHDDGKAQPIGELLLLDADELLERQLTCLTFHRSDRGRILMESKDDLAKRGIPSPDRADAVILSLHDAAPLFYVGDL